MMQQLAAATAAQVWAIASMVFFMAVFVVVVFQIVGKRHDEMEHCSRIPLNDDPPMPREDARHWAPSSKQGR